MLSGAALRNVNRATQASSLVRKLREEHPVRVDEIIDRHEEKAIEVGEKRGWFEDLRDDLPETMEHDQKRRIVNEGAGYGGRFGGWPSEVVRSLKEALDELAHEVGEIPLREFQLFDLKDGSAIRDRGGIPYVGDFVPEGFEKIDDIFADTSGFGSSTEPADTLDQLLTKLRRYAEQHGTIYLGLTQVGEFQGYVGVFIETEEGS